jgi:predicted HD phosphohydrolase
MSSSEHQSPATIDDPSDIPDLSRAITDFVISLVKSGSNVWFDEPVSFENHCLLCADAALKFDSQKENPELIIASFLHDIGQIYPPLNQGIAYTRYDQTILGDVCGRYGHAVLGERACKAWGFSSLVCHLVGQHTNAKIYKMRTHESTKEYLTHASLESATAQEKLYPGDCVMKINPFLLHVLKLREIDDGPGKVADDVPKLDKDAIYQQMDKLIYENLKEEQIRVQNYYSL